ncbi:MAG TPA: hypothetical protein VN541_12105 [Tepidisphaeraceae bacterium]|nr:hypothetical protein [Tepidisphaeraceae bacterium]
MICRILLLGLLGVFAEGAAAEGPSEFYVVSEFFSDNGALFYYRGLDVKPDGPDTIVRYIRIAPLNVICSRRVIVQARDVRLRNTSPADLVIQSNPCREASLEPHYHSRFSFPMSRRSNSKAEFLIPDLFAADCALGAVRHLPPGFYVKPLAQAGRDITRAPSSGR